MDRIPLKAEERTTLGKQVKKLRREGLIPAHVFGNKVETEHVAVNARDFAKAYATAGESGLIDLKIGAEKIRPVLIRDVQVDPVREATLHVDFYQVNLNEKVAVWVPIELIGDEPEVVHSGEAVVIQPMSEVEAEALPAELPEKLIVDISKLKQINDVITVAGMAVPEGVTVLADPEAVIVKLDTAVTEEMKKLMEEQAAEQEAAAAEAAPEEGAEKPEGEAEGEEGETKGEEEQKPTEEQTSEKPQE